MSANPKSRNNLIRAVCVCLLAFSGNPSNADDRNIPVDQPNRYCQISESDSKWPHPVIWKVAIEDADLIFVGETTKAGAKLADHPRSLLGKSGFMFVIDPFRNNYLAYVVAVDFAGNSSVVLMHFAEELTALNVKPKVRISEQKDKIILTVSVALKDLGVKPGNGDMWAVGCQACLLDTNGIPQSYENLNGGRIALWSTRNQVRFSYPQYMKTFVVGEDPKCISLSRGNLAPDEWFAKNRFSWTWLKSDADSKGTVTVTALDKNGKERTLKNAVFECYRNKPVAMNVRYSCTDEMKGIRFTAKNAGGRTLYESEYPVLPNLANHMPSAKNHFSSDCLEHVQPDSRLKGDCQITWYHALQKGKGIGLQMGIEYDDKEWWEYFKRHGQAMIVPDPSYFRGRGQLDHDAPYAREAGVSIALMPTAAETAGVPYPPKRSQSLFYADPRAQEAYLQMMREDLEKHKDVINYIYFGDEFPSGLVCATIYVWQHCRDNYPLIHEVNKEIKEKYGFGKYGIPEKSDWKFQWEYMEPYNWLALRRWVSQFTVDFAKRVKSEARKIKPDILIISPDEKAGNRPLYYELWRDVFDIATFQCCLKPVPEEQPQMGFGVKQIKDLAGTPHVWPLLHTTVLFSPEEMRDHLSQAFIAGADGLHIWTCIPRPFLINMLDGPGRDNMFNEFCDCVRSGLRAKHAQEKDVALLYSHDACAAHADEYGPPQPVRAYHYLSDGCGVNFRFISDLGLELQPDSLSGYKTMVVPLALIFRPNAAEQIMKAVKNGMNLIVLDPEAFSTDLAGNDISSTAESLRAGTGLIPHHNPKNGRLAAEASAGALEGMKTPSLPFCGNEYREQYSYTDLTPYLKGYTFTNLPQHAEVLLKYDDGQPAAISARNGKGTVIWTGVNPLNGIYGRDWVDFLRTLFKNLGNPIDLPVWRLKMPLKFEPVNKDLVYLTGNGGLFECGIQQITQDLYLPGTYTYNSLAPDQTKDVADLHTPIAFAQGKLTDRNSAHASSVSYKTGQKFSIDFDLSAPCEVNQIDVYTGNYCPALKIYSSGDGKNYEMEGATMDLGKIDGVKRISLAIKNPSKKRQFWRLEFQERSSSLTIIEIDFISKDGS